jgi:hypothetical protein
MSSEVDYFDVTFPVVFDGMPYVGFTVYPESSMSESNVGFWATRVTGHGFRANFTAPFSGSLLYRAVYNPGAYPVYVERMPGSGNYAWVSAVTANFSYESSITMSFDMLPNAPESVLAIPVGYLNDPLLSIAQAYSSVGKDYLTSELSSPFSGSMELIAISTDPAGSPQPVDPP